MTWQAISVELVGTTQVIRMNHPAQRNPLTRDLVRELADVMQQADRDPGVHAMVLTGAGSAFSAGADLKEFAQLSAKSASEHYYDAVSAADLFGLGTALRTPLIGAVNGPALGGGMGLAAMCHLVVASAAAKFGMTELRVGIVPFVILPLVRRAIGEKNTLKLMLTAEPVGPETALSMGLVQKVVPADRLLEEALALADHIGGFSPLAVSLALDAFSATQDMTLKEAFDYLARLRIVSFMSEDLQEGARAFLEKRPPAWKGR
ncbi:MAG: enoyl-CoA hydratase/isomerase family protein [Thermaerobacter sp.]|nr:enoyl-CoA hydratase/isomerase family protein [Thermaerobacter sp.]